ncbi:probable alpha,alpha-trehalose-phosphate synthase [UDP-forming] 7 [Oryza brachyantha]|uniref:alpha,alpha-trehalose-phosphate synthase (UDP-forming) n=1 Tax=Oryza brachyantha TaxID=4533 RepID=J3L424_ORYBR|nr:probable alpha,alpha-trehalose-phosphate synthase [UDP-forming] 7 [Oryza brachyantha]
MMSRSYTNLLDLAEGNFAALGPGAGGGGGGRRRSGSFGLKRMSRVMTVPGTLSELDGEEDSEPAATNSIASDVPSSVAGDRVIVVSNQLPIVARRRPDGRGWSFSWDDDSLLLQLRDGIPDEMEVLFVGSLRADVPVAEQDEVSQALLDRFRCAPVFLPDLLSERFYHRFCKRHLWPLFHYMLPFSSSASPSSSSSASSFGSGRFDRGAWEAYVLANKFFFEKVVEIINPEDDYVWVHDYHLMALPTFLRRRFNRLRIGFFLHSPFPSSEIYRTLPVREEILKALLNCDLIGFHTFDYARHFLSCCSRMLGIEYQSKRGYIGLDYFGRTVGIKIMPVGVHMGQLQTVLSLPDREWRVSELQQQFEGKTVLLGVDDMDIFKGINLKLLAFENLLRTHPKWQGRAVLVQIANPARGKGKDLEAIQAEIHESCKRINGEFGQSGYNPVVFIDRDVSSVEKIAYYTIAECVVVTAVRDGMNLTPYEYIVCRQGSDSTPEVNGLKKSMLVVSEFIGCSPSLSGAIRVNPWNIEATAEALNEAISMSEQEKHLRHEKHYRYVSTHDVAYWSKSFIQDLERACKDHFRRTCWGIGLGFGFRVVALDPHFTKLNMDSIVMAYERSKSRAIFLDYDGTLVPQTSISRTPSIEVLRIINTLCSDSRNKVFLVSGRRRDKLGEWFSSCPELGIAAEHGYFLRWTRDEEWQTCIQVSDFGWMEMAKPVMNLYTEATDGSYIDPKESALVWHHQDADPGFGSSQAKELLDHLESVLANEPVSVKSGQFIVEVKPQGVSKGVVAEKILISMKERGKQADFVLCIGDDRSDEDMFENIAGTIKKGMVAPNTSLFACTVGQKPSKAKFYLDDTFDVVTMLSALADATEAEPEAELADEFDELAVSDDSVDIYDEHTSSDDRLIGGS